MIENVCKSTRRKETVDDAYMEELFEDVTALYHLGEHALLLRERRSSASFLRRRRFFCGR